ncbi:CNK3/IPCEF1 fusion protein-like [Galendromus occidentalis]|uniref:CNK3/IPCEF1 fusion protein-like n=1 Tax=Galendromus occidentalis TaxID=34638 RepID=A0AAJ6QWS7_9ACAR|nr:CNK3/IPCEF1 fusion protein-like [Galendromus occidentalis]
MAYINIAEWTPEHVVEWARGVDNLVYPYIHCFLKHRIDGHRLLTLTCEDLARIGITKIGHQETILESVANLRHLHYNLVTENLQSLALRVGCHARSLHIQIQILTRQSDPQPKNISNEILAAACELISAVKQFIFWIDRPPFKGQDQYLKTRKTVLQLALELASTAQRDHFVANPLELIKQKCLCLAEISDFVVQEYADSLIIQPASLEVVTARKPRQEDDWGMQITTKYGGVHIVGKVRYQSPVQICAKVEEGDEIVQINLQTVLGWTLEHMLSLLQNHITNIKLTLKKRPRHSNLFGQMVYLKPHKIPINRISYEKQQLAITEEDGLLEPEPTSPRILREIEADDDAFLPEPSSGGETENGHNLVLQLRSQVKPKRPVLQRRATVTCASPTVSKPPVSFEDLVDSIDSNRLGLAKPRKNMCVKEHVTRSVSHDLPSKVKQFPAHHNHQQQHNHHSHQMLSEASQGRRSLPTPKVQTGSAPCRNKEGARKLPVPVSPSLPSPLKKIFASRCVSSESLLPADLQGWLYLRPKSCPKKWHKRWAILKNSYLYLFRSRHETRAACLVFLPGFSVVSAPECGPTRKFPFKLQHPTVSFYLAASEQADMLKWLELLLKHGGQQPTDGDIQRNSVMPDQTVYFSESEESNPESGEEETESQRVPPVAAVPLPPAPIAMPRENPTPKPRTIFLSSTLPRKSASDIPSRVTPGTPTKPMRNRNSSPQCIPRDVSGTPSPPSKRDIPPRPPAPDITEGMFKKAQQQQAERNKLKGRSDALPTTNSPPPHAPMTPPAIPPRCATTQQIKELYLQRNWGITKMNDDCENIYATKIEAMGSPHICHRPSPPPPPANKPDILAGTYDHDDRRH